MNMPKHKPSMPQEIETKVLDIDPTVVEARLRNIKGEKLLSSRITVDWFWEPGTLLGEEPWFLRVRSYSNGKVEITWKGKSEKMDVARQHTEINILVDSHEKTCDFFEAIGLVRYAHQEKDRSSWKLGNVQVDVDTYPDMPSYLEIEGPSEQSIQEAITTLQLQSHKTSNEGERILITNEYGLNWFDMRF